MMPPETLKRLVEDAKSGWLGCDWPTSFGSRQLDLFGVRSRHALMATKATRGDEAQCWLEAAKWLESVENAAAHAADFADQAVCACEAGDLLASTDCLLQAEQLEASYRDPVVYRGLRETWQSYCDEPLASPAN